ncbi:methyl-accepting chemotaxis protein [Syntrophus aciditrophicus]|uniref:Methyl-accepting chemotaxis protein n=1 Tax=Syntrophus aciditrophicus (strain SB) TaxID=56780 RepID=Q2LR59_SYNAS|nr:methyl-accepting chemotaxis protein [Syntrophus aciditrophicus]ABC76570.1 methyl-accepting chemotaxis protein [Syntrophus aciditrophicus SB]
MNMKLGTKLLTGGLLVVLAPLVVIGIASVYKSMDSISSIAYEEMTNVSNSLASTIDLGLSEELRLSQAISFSNSVKAAAEKVAEVGREESRSEIALVERELVRIREAAGNRYETIVLFGRDGIVYADAVQGKDHGIDASDRDYFKKAMQGNCNFSDVFRSKATGQLISMTACPIFSGRTNKIIGVVGCAINVGYLIDMVNEIKIGQTGYSLLVNEEGTVLAHPDKESILKLNYKKLKGMERVSEKAALQGGGVANYEFEGEKKVAAFSNIKTTGWTAFTTISRKELLKPAVFTGNLIAVIGFISLLLAAAFFYFFSRSLTRPLEKVVSAAEQIAEGDLSVQISDENRQDEIGMLARAFMKMTQSLQEKAGVLQQIAAGNLTVEMKTPSDRDVMGKAFAAMISALRAEMQSIREAVNVIASSATQISASTTELASAASQTASAVSETTSTVEEVKQTAHLSTQKATHVFDSAQKATEVSQQGRKAIDLAVEGMNFIRTQTDSISESIVKLSERSQAIGEIIATVNDIADQSNLLAVNAAIEAAKAGDQGKGFAVVAQEVRNLAEQSKQATSQVRTILNEVQKAVGEAVMSTEQEIKAVEAGVRQTSEAGNSFRRLSDTIEESAQAATQITASSQQQLVGMDQVVLAITNISQASSQNVAGAKQVETAAQNLHDLGQQLKQLIDRYRL